MLKGLFVQVLVFIILPLRTVVVLVFSISKVGFELTAQRLCSLSRPTSLESTLLFYQKTDSSDPGYFFGPSLFRFAKRGKQTIEKLTSLNMVAPMPRYRPKMPFVLSNSWVMLSAESFFVSPEINRFYVEKSFYESGTLVDRLCPPN